MAQKPNLGSELKDLEKYFQNNLKNTCKYKILLYICGVNGSLV